MEGDIDSSTKANSLVDITSPDRTLELETIMSAFDKENSRKP
jgi:hypothetical protein